jgi:lipopolysaccharide transport system ATP-binding protein
MSDVVIKVENLSKRYTIQHQIGGSDGFRHAIHDFATAPLRWLCNQTSAFRSQRSASNNGNGAYPQFAIRHPQSRTPSDPADVRPLTSDLRPPTSEEFWALKDVSFEVKQGEVVGIIGRNGAGKSTLLKILSRITEPTEGRVRIRGRVASLLEVGTGFHPELTGRENIFVNGAILGMTRQDILRKFDEIVAFAEIEKFLDTPVKRYSSGMYVRLAFAVAAHLDPEILIIDEVLAVGDAEFQKKCLGKMHDVATDQGRTVLFVSHNMAAVARLCTRGILLERGRPSIDGNIEAVVSGYNKATIYSGARTPLASDQPAICSVRIDDAQLHQGNLRVSVEFRSPRKLDPPLVGVVVHNHNGTPMFGVNTQMTSEFKPAAISEGVATLEVTNLPLHSGLYKLSVWLGEKNENYDVAEDVVVFHFVAPDSLPPGVSTDLAGNMRVNGRWSWSANGSAV